MKKYQVFSKQHELINVLLTNIPNLPKFHAWCHKFGKLAQKVLDIWQHVLYFMSLAWTHKVSYNVQQKLYECPFMNNST